MRRWQTPLAVLSFILGMAGYLLNLSAAGQGITTQPVLDAVFFTFKLFAGVAPMQITGDSALGVVCLNIARFTAPATLIIAFLRHFDDLWRPAMIRFRLRRLRQFDVIVGAGQVADDLLARNAEDSRWSIHVLNGPDETPKSGIDWDPKAQMIRLTGEALRRITRRRPLTPETLVFADECDLVNIQTAENFDRDRVTANCEFAHIGGEDLRLDTIAAGGMRASGKGRCTQVFSTHELAARGYFHTNDVFMGAVSRGQVALHLAVVGFSDDAAALVYHTLKIAPFPDLDPVRITIFASDPAEVSARLQVRLQGTDLLDQIQVRPCSTYAAMALLVDEMAAENDLSMWYLSEVSLAGAYGRAIGVAQRVRQRAAGRAQVVLPLTGKALAFVKSLPGNADGAVCCLCDSLAPLSHQSLAGEMDALARRIHAAYQGYKVVTDPEDQRRQLQDWYTLEENFKAANRRAADATKTKLEALGVGGALADLLDRKVSLPPLDPARREALSKAEHLSWAADRWINGWRFAPERDNTRRLHPDLVPFEDLSEPVKELDRKQVENVLSRLLRSSG